jgi:hypothetical protein
VPWRRKAHRGAPRKADAKRRRTTVLGRTPEVDRGTAQLRSRKRRIAAGREDLEINGASVLFAYDHLDRQQFDTLGTVTELLQRMARAWGGRDGSLNGLWSAILAASSSASFVPAPVADGKSSPSDSARGRLERLCRRLDGSRDLVIKLASGAVPQIILRVLNHALTQEDAAALEHLRQGLDAIHGAPRTAIGLDGAKGPLTRNAPRRNAPGHLGR